MYHEYHSNKEDIIKDKKKFNGMIKKFLDDTYYVWIIIGIISAVINITNNIRWIYSIFEDYDEEE